MYRQDYPPVTKNVKVVIGANFGDEGKGLMTDFFATQGYSTIVARFNGGAQAGHTVVTPRNKEHVFSHFGSATMDNIPTYLSKFFILNPILFNNERRGLLQTMQTDTLPAMYVDPECVVTTPYDMMVNQIVEMSRGTNRHGSCGYGINETVKRSEHQEFSLLLTDLHDIDGLCDTLRRIRDVYVPQRLKDLGIADIPAMFQSPITSDSTIDAFISDCQEFRSRIKLTGPDILGEFHTVVMEGAQGLLLDQNSVFFPHVTHSNTGLANVESLLSHIPDAVDVEVVYVTRCYLTRHGAGPLPNEVNDLPYPRIVDTTNIPNDWQGTLRFGVLDVDFLKENILRDVRDNTRRAMKLSLAVTCLDQVDDYVKYVRHGEHVESPISGLLTDLRQMLGTDWSIYTSRGRSRSTISLLERQ